MLTLSDEADEFAYPAREFIDTSRSSPLCDTTSLVDDPEVLFLRKRLFDDLTRTRTLDCDDDEHESDVSSFDSDSVALSVIVDQDLGLVGSTIPPSATPPPIPDIETEGVDYDNCFYASIDTSDNWSHVATADGDQI